MPSNFFNCVLLGLLTLELVIAQFGNTFEFTEAPLSPTLTWHTNESEFFGGWIYHDTTGYLESGAPRTDFQAKTLTVHFIGSGFRIHGELDTRGRDPLLLDLGSFWVAPNMSATFKINKTNGVIAEWKFLGAVRTMVAHIWIPEDIGFILHNVTTLIPVSTEAYVPPHFTVLTLVITPKLGRRRLCISL